MEARVWNDGRRSGEARDVETSGSYLYVAAGRAGLRVLDASDPRTLRDVGAFSFGELAHQVVVAEARAYVLGESAVHLMDVADPARPRQLGVTPNSLERGGGRSSGFSQIAVSGNYLYGASSTNLVALGGVAVVDVTDPGAPRQVGDYITGDRAVIGVGVIGPYVYAAVGCTWVCLTPRANLHVVDVADPTDPRLVADLPGPSGRISVAGSTAYVGAGDPANASRPVLDVVDARDAARPRVAGVTPPLAADGSGLFDVEVAGPRAHVTTHGAMWQPPGPPRSRTCAKPLRSRTAACPRARRTPPRRRAARACRPRASPGCRPRSPRPRG
jgi:hypothetical protein